MFCLCSIHPMSHIAFPPLSTSVFDGSFAIPAPPRLHRATAPLEPLWREAMRWSLVALSASLVAGEVVLWWVAG